MTVADRDHAGARGPSRDVGPSIADGRPGRQIAQLHQTALERHHRFELDRGIAARRPVPVGEEPDTQPVVTRCRKVDGARAVGGVDARWANAALRQLPQERCEALELVAREGEVVAVGVGKVREHAGQAQRRIRGQALEKPQASSSRTPVRPIPVSTSTWQRSGRPAS